MQARHDASAADRSRAHAIQYRIVLFFTSTRKRLEMQSSTMPTWSASCASVVAMNDRQCRWG
eukprot:1656603-Pleurochrysis_carterae.AAC.1